MNVVARVSFLSAVVLMLSFTQQETVFAKDRYVLPETSVQRYQEMATFAHEEGQFFQAIAYWNKVLEVHPDWLTVRYELARSYEASGEIQHAVEALSYVSEWGGESLLALQARKRLSQLRFSKQVLPLAQNQMADADRASNIRVVELSSKPSSALKTKLYNNTVLSYHGAISQIAVPLKPSENALIVEAVVRHGGQEDQGSFILDTGATYTSISTQMAKNLGINLHNSEKILITTANGRISVPKVLLKNLKVNGVEAHNVEATVIPISKDASFSGLLGLSFIRQFVMTIDTTQNQLIFKTL